MKIKSSHCLIGAVVIDTASVILDVLTKEPMLASIGLLVTTLGWLWSQLQLEKLQGETK